MYQDRLVKEMRLRGISDLKSANKFFRQEFLPALNRKLVVRPARELDLHRPPPHDLSEILSWQEPREAQRDWTVVRQGRWVQIDRAHEALCLAGKK